MPGRVRARDMATWLAPLASLLLAGTALLLGALRPSAPRAHSQAGQPELRYHAHLPCVASQWDGSSTAPATSPVPPPTSTASAPLPRTAEPGPSTTTAATVALTLPATTATGTPSQPTDTPTVQPATATATLMACPDLARRVSITSNRLDDRIRANDEYFPLPLAPRPEGDGALVAWREEAGARIRIGTFDLAGRLVGVPLTFSGEEVHALVAHEDGGAVVVVANDPDIYSPKYCRGPSSPDKPLCAKLDVWRFDSQGSTLWRTTATGKKNVDSDGAHFIWWYQHTARLVWSGTEYGLYFRSASSSPRPGVPGEIDIHAGDSFRFLDGRGTLLDSAWRWGCSHSWSVRLAYNGHFGAACHGDAYPNAFHVNLLDRQRRLAEATLHEGLDPTKRALGGMVATTDGFWLLHMAQGREPMELHLAFIDNAGRVTRDEALPHARDLETTYPFRGYLAAYGATQMLAGWVSKGSLQLAVLDRSTGAWLDGPVAVGAKIDKWNEFVSYPNGDVGWAWSPDRSDRLDLVRVTACQP